MLGINSHLTLRKITHVGVLRFVIAIMALTSAAFAPGAVLTIARAGSPTFITFDVPGQGTGFDQGTGDELGAVPISIAPDGTVAGFIRDPAAVRHGFVRDPRGNITVFDAPNAGAEPTQGTHAYSISPSGTITGWYYDAYFVAHGFVRTREGAIGIFDVPGAGTGTGQGTITYYPNITPNGTLTGYSIDDNGVEHGFLRDREGGITVFDVPAGAAGAGTQAVAINTPGAITGYYFDANFFAHGFVRSKQGSITTFDAQGAAIETFPGAINPSGAISGFYLDGTGTPHCFVRAPGGAVTTIDAPAYATAGSACFSALIAPDGTVAATYFDGTTGNEHAFLRDATGAITDIDVPGPLAVNGTFASTIGVSGVVVGNCADSNMTLHGFIRTP